MKKWWDKYGFIIKAFFLWRLGLFFVEIVSPGWWQTQFRFLGNIPWGNFDGVHYVVIATQGYLQYEQAFFPFYPLLIALFTFVTHKPPEIVGVIVSQAAFFGGLFFFYESAKALFDTKTAQWATLLLLAFPMSFFFAGVYSEGVFFLLSTLCIYFTQKRQYVWASLAGMFAAATRLFGVALWAYIVWEMVSQKSSRRVILLSLLVPVGLAAYMIFLSVTVGDPLAFFHVQPEFGAGRTGGEIVLLPQVLWRYGKIMMTASRLSLQYWVAIGELLSFVFGSILVLLGFRRPKLRSLAGYSALVLILPPLTGTLSSMPRYLLSAFPLFFVLANVHNTQVKAFLLGIFVLGLTVAASLFLGGYFIS